MTTYGITHTAYGKPVTIERTKLYQAVDIVLERWSYIQSVKIDGQEVTVAHLMTHKQAQGSVLPYGHPAMCNLEEQDGPFDL